VKARLAWLAGGIGVGLAAAYRALRARSEQLPPAEEERPDPRADELRHKLAEARAAVDERDDFEAAETPVDEIEEVAPPVLQPEAEPEPQDLDERRRRVHDRAKASARKMRGREPEA
jgi:hypothetical protein